jgi:hypothetical protein
MWVNAIFPSPLKITPQKPLWVTLRAKTGSVEWAGTVQVAAAAATTLLNNEGGAWQTYPAIGGKAVVGMARVLRRPFSKDNQPLLSFVCEGATATAEPVSGAARVGIDFAAASEPLVKPQSSSVSLNLAITALATGKLTIKKARVFYRETA